MKYEAVLSIPTVSEANCTEHFTVKAKRHRAQQAVVRSWFKSLPSLPVIPAAVRFTRIAPRELDDDNLHMAFKWIRDELSELILQVKPKAYRDRSGRIKMLKGRADSDKRLKWLYGQEKGQKQAIRIEITELQPDDIDHE